MLGLSLALGRDSSDNVEDPESDDSSEEDEEEGGEGGGPLVVMSCRGVFDSKKHETRSSSGVDG